MSKKKGKSSARKKNVRHTTQSDKQAAKKALVMGEQKMNRTPLIIAGGVLLMVAAAAFYLLKPGGPEAVSASATQIASSGVADTSQVSISAAQFEDGQARHFSHADGSTTVKYFILKSSDGIIRAAFDACDVCWPAGKGYYQEGDHMVCRNCGRRFQSVMVNEVQGGCNPAPLKRRVEGGQVILDVADILEGRRYFNFS